MPSPRAPWWMYLIAASLVVAYCLNVWNEVMGPQSGGFATTRPVNLQVREIVPGGPFAKAGVRKGDVLLAVDGQRLGYAADWFAVRTNFEIGKPFTLDVQRGQETLHLPVVLEQRRFRLWDAGDYVAVLSVRGAQLILLALALLIVFKRPYDLSARLAGWLLGSLAAVNAYPPYGTGALVRHMPAPIGLLALAALIFSLGGATAWFCFFAMFPRRLLTRPWHWLLALLPGAVSGPFLAIWLARWVYFPDQVTGFVSLRFFLAAVLVFVVQELAGLGILVSNYFRLRDVNERRKVGVLLMGTAVGLPAAYAAVIPVNAFMALGGAVLFLVFPFSFAYAILRHRLFDVQVIIRQGLQYALARGVMLSLGPALGAIFVLDLFLHGDQTVASVLRARAWVYVALGGLAALAEMQRQKWFEALDRRFFRERYDAQRLLREVVEEVRGAEGFERVAPRVVARIDAALHPEFVALLVRDPREASYRILASAPAGQTPPTFSAESKLVALVRLLGKPLEISLTETSWLKLQLPHEETDFLRRARIDLLVPVALAPGSREALLAVGIKRSEEPYTREDQDLLIAVASSLALLLERPVVAPTKLGEALEECPQCGTCYETGMGHCPQEGASLALVRLPRFLSGRYRLERRRGRGGMGAVYEATDTGLERRVAVKVIRDDLVGSGEAAERFRREARAAAGFTHPNVVTVHDFGVAGDTRAFLVMELLDGKTLREELVKEKRLPAARMLGILQGVCDAVDAAHRRQLIHRDLKPENIFLARGETTEIAKILDFGIAKFLPAATQATADTGTGALVGTVRYMSPEQLQGSPADPAWDLWAIAVVTYEMLTGAHPFADPNPGASQVAVLAGRFTPVTAHFPDAPSGWQGFFARAFALEKSQRPATAHTFFAELETAIS